MNGGSSMAGWWRRLIIGGMADRCPDCGAMVPAGSEFRVAPWQVYCSEEHAVADQQNNPL